MGLLCCRAGGGSGGRRRAGWSPLQHAPRGAGGQVQTGSGKYLGDPLGTEMRTRRTKIVHDSAHEFREATDRLNGPNKRGFTFFVESLHPICDGRRLDQKDARGFGDGPSACCAQLQDREAFTADDAA